MLPSSLARSARTVRSPLLRRLAIAPSGDNSTPNTESQVLRRIISFVGTGFDYVGEEVEQQLAHMMSDVMIPLQQDNGAQAVTIAALQRANAALQPTIRRHSDQNSTGRRSDQ